MWFYQENLAEIPSSVSTDTPKWKQPLTSTSLTWLWQTLWSPPPCPFRAPTICSTLGHLAKWRARSSSLLITTTCLPASSPWPWWAWTVTLLCATPLRLWISAHPSRPRSSMWSSGCCHLLLGSLLWYLAALRPIMVSWLCKHTRSYTLNLLHLWCLTGVYKLLWLISICVPPIDTRYTSCKADL